MLGLAPLGTFHTAISLIAVGAGAIALVRDGQTFLIGAALQVRRMRRAPVVQQ